MVEVRERRWGGERGCANQWYWGMLSISSNGNDATDRSKRGERSWEANTTTLLGIGGGFISMGCFTERLSGMVRLAWLLLYDMQRRQMCVPSSTAVSNVWQRSGG
jgi:hypothetical protein